MAEEIKAIIEEVKVDASIEDIKVNVALEGAIIEEFENPLIVNAGKNIEVEDTGFSEIEVRTVDDPDFTGIHFDTVNPIDLDNVGDVAWNEQDGTLDIKLKGNNVTLQVGQELVKRVVNKTNANLLQNQYKVVRVRTQAEGGSQGQRIAVKLAQADTQANHTDIIGVVTENIGNNQEGFVTVFGEVNKINTTGSLQGETWLDGDTLYLSPTVAGGLTKIKPIEHPTQIGYVTYAHQNQGKIWVKISNGLDEIDELHDVIISNVQNKDILQYNSSNNKWENQVLNKSSVGLGNVDNTSDLNKPISTATQTALDGKVDKIAGKGLSTEDYTTAEKNKLAGIEAGAQVNTVTSVAGKTGAVSLVKADVGLSNVDNTLDLNKPISTATQTALNAKENTITAGTTGQYYRGDKTFQTLDKTAVGLGNVVNTDTTTTANITDSANKRFITDAQQTVLTNISGTNTGDQNLFSTIAVAGQSNVVADSTSDTLTLVAGSNITLTTNATNDSITIASSGGGGSAEETFETVSKNLKSYPATFNYTSGTLTSIVYTLPVGTITKTLNYTTGTLTSIVLSGDTPAGIDLTKTLGYTGDELTSITYS